MKNIEHNVVRMESVWFGYNSEPALENVSLCVKQRDFLIVIGPNGGGKTTLLKLLIGLIKPNRENIKVFGLKPELSRSQVGYVPQRAVIDPQFPVTVWDVVLMGRLGGRRLGKKYSAEDRKIAADALEKVSLYEMRNRRIGKISAGQRQRALIARALAVQPQLLLLDEPTASLDSKIKRDIYKILSALNDHMTIVMVSHDIEVVSRYAKTVACLNCRLAYHNEKSSFMK